MTHLIEMKNVIVERDGARVLDGVSMHLERGERLAVIGSNGAGKTTFLRALIGLQKLSGGSIEAFELASEHRVPVILAGMKVPPNYGPDYQKRFEAIYPRLAREFRIPLIPVLLDGVAGVRELNLEDGIHPNEKGQEKIAKLVESQVAAWISRQLQQKEETK
jgi:ABC-type cobalamin/Fe3+-siderophores transport system ATPase subunit